MTDSSPTNYPSAYHDFEKHVEVTRGNVYHLGYPCGRAITFRFCARYRLARSFTTINADGYSSGTIDGYSGLFRVFLAFSAYELFWKVIGVDQHLIPHSMEQTKCISLWRDFQKLDPAGSLFSFLRARVNPALRGRLDGLKNGNVFHVVYLAASVRHIFGHGELSAQPQGMNSSEMSTACGILFSFLMDFMDETFTSLVNGRSRGLPI